MSARIAGLGAVTGYGWGRDVLWSGLMSGQSAGSTTEIDGRPCLAARVPEPPDGGLPGATRMERATFAAIAEAIEDARSREWSMGDRPAIVHSTGAGDIETLRDKYFSHGARPRPSLFPHVLPTAIPSLIAREYGIRGPNVVVNAACASVNFAAILALQWLDSGFATDIIISSAEFCVIEEIVVGFRRLGVLIDQGDPLDVCRPFQEGSRGFFLGEAAVALVISRDVAHPYASLLGGAITHDAFHLTGLEPSGAEVRRCFEDAVRAARFEPDRVLYVNAHGTGTRANDSVEGKIVNLVMPGAKIYATKPLSGHCMGVSAGVELVIAALSYHHDIVPAAPHVDVAHAALLDGPEPRADGATLSSALGIGGYNSAVVIDRP